MKEGQHCTAHFPSPYLPLSSEFPPHRIKDILGHDVQTSLEIHVCGLKPAPMQGNMEGRGSYSWLVGGRCNNQGLNTWGLSWVASRKVNLCTCLPKVKTSCGGLSWISNIHCASSLSTTVSLGSFWEEGRQAKHILKG